MARKRPPRHGLPAHRGQMTLDRLYEVCRIFGLREFPRDIPFATNVGLDLPDRPLTGLEIRKIGGGAAGPTQREASWYIGDLLLYLQRLPDAPISYDTMISWCRRAGLKHQTLANYKSVARSFPFAERHPGVPWVMHSLVRALPRKQRDQLLARAANENLTPEELRLLVKAARGATRSEIVAAKLESEVKHLYSARPDRNELLQTVDRCTALLNELREITTADSR